MAVLPAFRSAAFAAVCLLAFAFPVAAGTVDFDDRVGKGGPFSGACGASFEVDDEYLPLGVVFSSNDPAICVIAPGNAVSPPNVATGITSGDIDFLAPLEAAFFDGATPVAVSAVTLELTSGSQAGVEAYDQNGAFLGDSGKTGEGLHVLSFPRLIHKVRISGGAYSLDDFSFSPPGTPETIPALPVAGALLLFALTAGAGALALRRVPRCAPAGPGRALWWPAWWVVGRGVGGGWGGSRACSWD
jgi:hypothetical protein